MKLTPKFWRNNGDMVSILLAFIQTSSRRTTWRNRRTTGDAIDKKGNGEPLNETF